MGEPQIRDTLPENAYRELKEGESYVPMVPPNVTAPEITTRSIMFGIVMNVIFSMAATYLALKVGQGIETAIPISILAVGMSGFLLRFGFRRSSLIENVNILAISTTSGIVAGGTVFTMPAIYVLKLNSSLEMSNASLFFQIFLVPFLGAVLGVLFLIPFRRYFVKDMHGKLPFPEATATNEILVTGSGGSAQAFVLIYSFIIGLVYNWVSGVMKVFTETFTSAAVPKLENLTNKSKAVFSLGTGAEFLGLGFIIGVRYASIICAGSFLSWFVIIPLLAPLNLSQLQLLNPACEAHHGPEEAEVKFVMSSDLVGSLDAFEKKDELEQDKLAELYGSVSGQFVANGITLMKEDPKITVSKAGSSWKLADEKQTYTIKSDAEQGGLVVKALLPGADDIFLPVPRNIGIGCIFTAGLLSILKMSKVIVTALRQALGGLIKSKGKATGVPDRTDEDISYPVLLIIGAITTVAIWIYFRYVVLADMPNATSLSLISLVLALGVAFVFTTVSAWAIAMISVTPISGMTVTTIIITAVVLLACGLPKDEGGMLATLLVGGVVASALSMAGTLVTEFKIGYWLGASPKKIQWSAIIAAVLASAVVTGTIMVLAASPGYDAKVNTDALQAPQANMMASALESFIGTGDVPWTMYITGVVMAFLLELVGVSPLAFGLGMYLPMELNAPILVGAIVAALVKKSSKNEKTSKARNDRGILIASGLIAGAAISGVLKSVLNIASEDALKAMNIGGGIAESLSNWLGLIAFVAICCFVYWDSCRAKAQET